MKIAVIISALILLIDQVIGQTPIIQYDLYDGNFSDTITAGRELINTTNFQSNFVNRYGDSLNALDLATSTDDIRIPYQQFNQLGTGDFTIQIWLYIRSLAGQNNTLFQFDGSNQFALSFRSYGFAYLLTSNGTEVEYVGANYTQLNEWAQFSMVFNSSAQSLQLYVNGQTLGSLGTTFFDYNFTENNADLYLGSYQGTNQIDGAVAELKIYDQIIVPEVIIPETYLNTFELLSNACPTNTSEWNIGDDSTKRVCIHDTCASRFMDLMDFVENNLTISTNNTGLNWADNITLDFTVSKMDCGSGNDEECFIDDCFQFAILQAEDSDYNLTSLPASVDLFNPSETTGFIFEDYHNNTDCTHTTNTSTCHFIMPFFFAGTSRPTTFTRDKSFIELEFTVEYAKVPGEDTISATLIDQSFSTVTYIESNDVEANIENTAQPLAGATLNFDGSAPASIAVGDDIDLVFAAPAGNLERDFKNGTFEVELVFTSNGTEISIPVTPSSTTYVNNGNSTAGAERSVQFTLQANYLGTYTIRAAATLESGARRVLLEEESGLNSQLEITVVEPKQNIKFDYTLILIAFSIVMLVAQYYYMSKKKQSSLEKQSSKEQYEQVTLDSKA